MTKRELLSELNKIDRHYTYKSVPGSIHVNCTHSGRGICHIDMKQAKRRLVNGWAKWSRAYRFMKAEVTE